VALGLAGVGAWPDRVAHPDRAWPADIPADTAADSPGHPLSTYVEQGRGGEASAYAPTAVPRSRHVVVLIMDGGRYDHTFGDPEHRYVPHMWNELAPQGVVLERFYNAGHTITLSGHATLATGRRERVLGEAAGRFQGPTIFERSREDLELGQEAVWLIFGKTKLGQVFNRSMGAAVYRPSMWAEETDDATVAARLWQVLEEARPALTLVNFPSVDRSAHAGDWPGYLNAISQFDALAAETWRRIQADPELAASTTLVVTNDHGRQYDDWTRHGDDSEGSRRIMFLALGPDLKPNASSRLDRSLTDLEATVACLMGVAMPSSQGTPMLEILLGQAREALIERPMCRSTED